MSEIPVFNDFSDNAVEKKTLIAVIIKISLNFFILTHYSDVKGHSVFIATWILLVYIQWSTNSKK